LNNHSTGVRLTQSSQELVSERLLKIKEVADRTGYHRNTIWNLIKSGKLPAVRTGARLVRVRESDLAKLFTDYKAGEFGKWS
jgi:excisionase family DNA binding protein